MKVNNIIINEKDIEYYIPKETLQSIFYEKEYHNLVKNFVNVAKIKLQNKIENMLFNQDIAKYLLCMYVCIEVFSYVDKDYSKFENNINNIVESSKKTRYLRLEFFNQKYPDYINDYNTYM